MKKPICYVGIAMHPTARKELNQFFEITEDMNEIGKAHAAICYGVPEEWAEPGAAPQLRAIGCHSCEGKAAEWVSGNGISLTLADSLWRTVAEHTLALMMCAARNIIPADREIRDGRWCEHVRIKERHSGFDFQGKTLGIIGMGQIGTQLADLVRGFRMNVIYYDICRLAQEKEKALDVSFFPMYELLGQADYLSILIPHTEETHGMFGSKEFAAMKQGVIFVNTARAGIIQEEAFLAALESGKIGAAALDVFWDEGMAQKPELTNRSNVVMTPHLGGSTCECDMVLVNGVIKTACYAP